MTVVELLLLVLIAAPFVAPPLILIAVFIDHRRWVAIRAEFERKLARDHKERMKRGQWTATVRQYGRSIPVDELIRSCTIESEIPRAAGREDNGKD